MYFQLLKYHFNNQSLKTKKYLDNIQQYINKLKKLQKVQIELKFPLLLHIQNFDILLNLYLNDESTNEFLMDEYKEYFSIFEILYVNIISSNLCHLLLIKSLIMKDKCQHYVLIYQLLDDLIKNLDTNIINTNIDDLIANLLVYKIEKGNNNTPHKKLLRKKGKANHLKKKTSKER